MDEHPLMSRKWLQRFSWLWLAIALWGAVMTPFVAVSFYRDLVSGNRLMILPMLLALPLRCGQIWLFYWLWLKHRAKSEGQEDHELLLCRENPQKEK